MELTEEFLGYLEHEKRVSVHTLSAYERDLEQFSAYLRSTYEEDEVVRVSAVMIRSWLVNLMEEGMSPRTVNRKLSTLRSFYRYLIREGRVEKDPLSSIVAPKIPKRLPGFVEEAPLNSLFGGSLFPDNKEGRRDSLLLLLLYETGIRRAELIGLKVSDLDGSRRMLKVRGKRNKERFIPVSRELIDTVNSYLEERPAPVDPEFLLLDDRGKQMSASFVYRKVNHYLGLITTMEKKSPHILRHSFATHLLNRGADLNAIKEVLGHASLAATQVYTHNTIDKLLNVYRNTHPKG